MDRSLTDPLDPPRGGAGGWGVGGGRGASGSSDSEQLAFASARFAVAAVTLRDGE